MNKRQIIQFICSLLVIGFSLIVVSNILKRKDSDIEYQVFYEKSDEYDVLFFGPSVIHYGIFPMQLWNDYGITSYNMANDSERLAMTYHHIKNALDYSTPEMIVVDLTAMGWAGTTRDNSLKDHNFLDSVPLSRNKIDEVVTIFNKEDRLQYLFTWYIYHARWEYLEEKDFSWERNVYYGGFPLTGNYEWKEPTIDDYALSRYGEVKAEQKNILNIIELCKEQDIEILFIYYPCPVRGGDQRLREYCEKFLKESGVDYMDLLYIENIDWKEDFIQDGHANYYGAEKVTDSLGRILVSKYGIKDHRTEKEYSATWNDDYMQYKQLIASFQH